MLSKHCLDATVLVSVYRGRVMELRAVKLWSRKEPLFSQVPLPLDRQVETSVSLSVTGSPEARWSPW